MTSKIGAFVEIQKGVRVGNRCKISSHSFLCEGVTLEEEVFIGHGVTFINDRFPRATNADGSSQTEADWTCIPTTVKRGASIGSGATILCGVVIGERATVGAGSVVTKDVPAGQWSPATRRGCFVQPPPPDAMATMRVPFLDLRVQHEPLMTELVDAFRQVIPV